MREGTPSRTATWVAFDRGLASIGPRAIVQDALAERLVPRAYGALLRMARRMPRITAALLRVQRALSAGVSLHIAFRTRAIDDAVEAAASRGAEQLVIVGAGLDSRAWRIAALRDVRVYEVDHPATQIYKRARVAAFAVLAKVVQYIAADLERVPLGDSLAAAGHDPTRKSVFLWEGVTMYLTRAAIETTLATIAARSAPGSGLVVSYWEAPRRSLGMRLMLWALARAGEPIRSTFSRVEMKELLARHGFDMVADGGTREWAGRYLPGAFRETPERVIWGERAPLPNEGSFAQMPTTM
jgi:methyltransferase (TIGR00027 family)